MGAYRYVSSIHMLYFIISTVEIKPSHLKITQSRGDPHIHRQRYVQTMEERRNVVQTHRCDSFCEGSEASITAKSYANSYEMSLRLKIASETVVSASGVETPPNERRRAYSFPKQ